MSTTCPIGLCVFEIITDFKQMSEIEVDNQKILFIELFFFLLFFQHLL